MADTRQANACHRWLRIEIDWKNDTSDWHYRSLPCSIFLFLCLVVKVKSQLENLSRLVVVLEIDIYDCWSAHPDV